MTAALYFAALLGLTAYEARHLRREGRGRDLAVCAAAAALAAAAGAGWFLAPPDFGLVELFPRG